MKFRYEIIETHKKVVEIQAKNIIEATNKVYSDYENKEITLNDEDFTGVEIYILNAEYGKK